VLLLHFVINKILLSLLLIVGFGWSGLPFVVVAVAYDSTRTRIRSSCAVLVASCST
jgi:hypothetical protein